MVQKKINEIFSNHKKRLFDYMQLKPIKIRDKYQ
jgi:hypothetical protein